MLESCGAVGSLSWWAAQIAFGKFADIVKRVWSCMLATCRSYWVCWAFFGFAGPSLGLYVGNLQVLLRLLGRLWGCMLATYRSYWVCWAFLGAVCWQPTGLMGVSGPLSAVCWQPAGLVRLSGPLSDLLRLYVNNLRVLWGFLDRFLRFYTCMLATDLQVLWARMTAFGGVCWQPRGLWALLDRLWGCMLATYRSCGGCWTAHEVHRSSVTLKTVHLWP